MPATLTLSALRFRDLVREGEMIAWPQGPGEPLALSEALMAQGHELRSPSLFLGMSVSRTVQPEHARVFALRGLNGAGTNRRLTAEGLLDVVPCHVSTVPALLRTQTIKVDVALVQVRRHPILGGYTFGVIADYTQALVRHARLVIAQVNDALPVTSDDALVAEDDLDVLVETPGHVIEMPDPLPQDIDAAVAKQVAAVIPDRATVQLGIGALPVAVARALAGHRDLGIHSGVISDVVVDLVESGVVTNACKGRDSGRIVTGGLFGTQRLYRFASGNDAVAMRSVEYTHSQVVAASLQRFHTVNSAIEVDLSGQVNAEIAGGRYLGAVGGQVDFVRGGVACADGRSIIALPASTADGTQSRIVAALGNAPVTTARSDVDLIVTEFGVADLRGCSLRERARRLIAIAHPKFREALERASSPGFAQRSGIPNSSVTA
jgi:acyl-CoA hydrolase